MIRTQRWLGLGMGLAIAIALSPVLAQGVLRPIPLDSLPSSSSALPLGYDDQIWGSLSTTNDSTIEIEADRQALLTAIDLSLRYLRSPAAASAYQNYPVAGVSRDRVRRSLERFRQLVTTSTSAAELQTAVAREFEFYQSIGTDGMGTVAFTGYFEPTYEASRVPTDEFRYPIYRLPTNFNQWSLPHPTRAELEGMDGLQASQGRLRGSELVWFRHRLDAYLIQVQGSARLQLTDGTTMSVGVAGRTEYPYTSIGRALVDDGKIAEEGLTLPAVIQYFEAHPEELNTYLPRNNRFIFFRETNGAPATGSLGLPVTPERSIATDKSIMPPGALALIVTQLPYANANGVLEQHPVHRYVLDQDTGGAIRGAGRVDIFMGSGEEAGDRAGLINHSGQLYYLLLRE